MQMEMTMHAASQDSRLSKYELIDSVELASRWPLPQSQIREQLRSRAADPLPHFCFRKYVRFRWGSPELGGVLGRSCTGIAVTSPELRFLRLGKGVSHLFQSVIHSDAQDIERNLSQNQRGTQIRIATQRRVQ